MAKNARQEALNLLAEPFATNYGFCHACVVKIQKMLPADRIEFLSCILENYGLVPQKKTLSMIEHLLSVEKLDQLETEQKQNLALLSKATMDSFPPTEEFAKFLLGAMEAHEALEEKALILRQMILQCLLPYAPILPKASGGLTKEQMEKIIESHPKEAAMIARLIAFRINENTFLELAEILIKIIGKKPANVQTLLLSSFLVGFARHISIGSAKAAIKSLTNDEDEIEIVLDEDDPGTPPKNGNGS